MSEKSQVRLSASRIKTCQDCSWRYYTSYVLKLPDPGNSGSSRGTCVHQVLECLLRPDRKPYSRTILKNKDAFCVPAIARLINIHARRENVFDNENLGLINEFIVRALSADFYADGALKVTGEAKFEEKNERFWVLGYIDKIAEYVDHVLLVDYKTQKNFFTEDQLEFSIQALMYLMIAKAKYPGKRIEFEFHQLKEGFEGRGKNKTSLNMIQKVKEPSDDVIEGFKEWLADYSEYLSDFTLEKAKANFAKKDFLKSRIMCGGVPGQRRKSDGGLMFICPSKMPKIYFAIYEGENMIKTAYEKADLTKILKTGQEIRQMSYGGCPAWSEIFKKTL